MTDVGNVLAELQSHGKTRQYGCLTVYVDHQMPGWSLGADPVKLRLRQYDDGSTYLEHKTKVNGVTQKSRVKMKPQNMPSNLVPVGVSSYKRIEFEDGKSRITIDSDVRINGLPFSLYILELKGEPPSWFTVPKEYEHPDFSKSSFMLGRCHL